MLIHHEQKGASPMMEKILAIDFDGTITRHSRYPNIGEANTEFIDWLKKQKEDGCKLILWTCRTGRLLQEAVEFCEKHGLTFDAVNENLPEIIEKFGGDTRKIFAHKYIDDASAVPWEIVKPKPKQEKPVTPMRKARIVR